MIEGFFKKSKALNSAIPKAEGSLVGMISPHIDYQRGWKTYAQLWDIAKESIDNVEVIFILGTNHYGEFGTIIPTLQNYSTPIGIMRTNKEIVNRLISKLGNSPEELHHATEHSIQLACNWVHHTFKNNDFTLVPILCGSFHEFITSNQDPKNHKNFRSQLL